MLETGATFGKLLTPLADYAALRGLAMVRPAELTEFDQAYLKSLCRVQGLSWARYQARQMTKSIARENGQAGP